jgi:hypothetical protein
MFKKVAENAIQIKRMSVVPLNIPQGDEWNIFRTAGEGNLSIDNLKVSELDKDKDTNGYDLKEAIKKNPDKLFLKCFAIEEDAMNENGDLFPAEELEKAAETFIGVPLFCNHANDDIEKARGKVVHAWYDKEAKGIYVISMVDKIAYPQLARGIEEGYITGTSMGCQVHHSYCSICHNMAHTADQYCTHVKNSKTRKFSGTVKCQYHKSKVKEGESAIEEECPVCGCKEGEKKEIVHKEAYVYERNVGLKFIENSFVVNPACKNCGVSCILNTPEIEKAANSIRRNVTKMANWIGGANLVQVLDRPEVVARFQVVNEKFDRLAGISQDQNLIKTAGKQEVDYLNRAMKMMEVVAKSMMDQKEQVSMEYVSDIVDVLASLQTATDELVEMGYAQLPSPPTLQNPEGLNDAVPTQTAQPGGVPQAGQQPQAPAAPQPTGASTSPAGGIGSVTKPSFTPSASEKLKEMVKEGSNLHGKPTGQADNDKTHASSKESEDTMSLPNKTAAGDALKEEHLHITTEKRLEDAKLSLHPRTHEAPTGVTESKEQLGLSKEPVNDTTSKSPQVRDGDYYHVTTENQLPDIEGPIARWEEYPEVTTEKQWTDFTREVGAVLSKDQDEHTTQSQLRDLLSHHRWVEPHYTTENQLKSEDNWLTKDNAWLDKAAAAAYSKKLVTAAIESLSDAVAVYHKTPAEIVKAVSFFTDGPTKTAKAAFLTLINGSPCNVKARKAEKLRSIYFGKTASSVGAVDAVLACMGDHCTNLKSEDFVDAVRYVATDAKRLAAVQSLADEKIATGVSVETETVVDKTAAFDAAFDSLNAQDEGDTVTDDNQEDGLHVVKASVSEIGTDDTDDAVFIKAATAFARAKVGKSDTVLYKLDLGDQGDVFITLKETSHLTDAEKQRLAEIDSQNSIRVASREELVAKTAQFGGAMGPGMDGSGGGGAGATMPTPGGPPAGAPGADATPPVESLEGDPSGDTGDDAGDDKEPLPPGSICPVCGSDDVDIVEGKGKCNNCKSQFVFKVEVEVTRWTGVNDSNSNDEGAEGEAPLGEEGAEGEGFAMPEGGDLGAGEPAAAPNIPVAAMTKLTPFALQKVAEAGLNLGSVSPFTGTKNTHKLANGKFLCLDSGSSYEVITLADTKDPKAIWAEWRWTPKFGGSECSSCRRAKSVWATALKTAGITDEQFEKLSFIKKADTILELDRKGLFRAVKTASKDSSVVAEFKKASAVDGEFPVRKCREKIANRYGEGAIAISGPCKGEKLYDCVCNQLKKASVYSDGLALKVAESWKDRDGCLECMEDYVRFGYDLTKSATVCQHLKVKYASPEDLFAEELSDTGAPGEGGDEGHGDTGAPGEGDEFADAPDFDNPEGHGGNEGDVGGDLSGGEDISIDVQPDGQGGEEINIDGGDLGGDLSAPLELPGSEAPGAPAAPGAPTEGPGKAPGHGDVTLHIPLHALDAIEQAIDSAKGENPAEEPHHDIPPGMGNEEVDVNVPGDVADGLEETIEPALDEAVEGNPEGGEGGEDFGGDDFGGDTEGGDGSGGNDFGGDEPNEGDFAGGTEDTQENSEPGKGPEVSDENSEFKETEADHMASVMRRGKRVGQIDMDLSGVLAALKKEAEEGSDVKWELAQDAAGKVSDGGTIGNEEKFDADKPSVPVGGTKAEMGKTESHPPQPGVKVPQKGPTNKNETEQGYTADGASATGGNRGQGKTPTASSSTTKKVATDGAGKKLNPPKPTSEVTDVDFSGGHDLKTTPECMKRKPVQKSEENLNVPENGEGAFLGDEKNSIGNIPKATQEFAPQIPTGGGMNPKYDKNEKNKPEMTTDIRGVKASKGTIGGNTVKSQKAVEDAAVRIAARMLKAQLIDDADLMKKISELKRYDLPQLADIEKSLFRTAKGLAMASDGVESPVPVADSSAGQRNSQDDLTKDLSKLFTLTHRVEEARQYTDADLRGRYNRR